MNDKSAAIMPRRVSRRALRSREVTGLFAAAALAALGSATQPVARADAPYLVADINTLPASSSPNVFATMNGVAYFGARTERFGLVLWRRGLTNWRTWSVDRQVHGRASYSPSAAGM